MAQVNMLNFRPARYGSQSRSGQLSRDVPSDWVNCDSNQAPTRLLRALRDELAPECIKRGTTTLLENSGRVAAVPQSVVQGNDQPRIFPLFQPEQEGRCDGVPEELTLLTELGLIHLLPIEVVSI